MRSLSFQNLVFIVFTIFITLVLTLITPPSFAIWFNPCWVEMIIFFWILYLPQNFNLGVAWFVGLLVDVLSNSPLGEHAATLIVASALVKKFYQRLHMFSLLQQTLAISVIILLHQLLFFWLQHLLKYSPTWIIWTPAILNLFLWPSLVITMKKITKRGFIVF